MGDELKIPSGTGPLDLDPVPHDSAWQPVLEEVMTPFRTDAQERLRLKHGTPAEFRRALGRALWNYEIDYEEYSKAAEKYEAQWVAAGKLKVICPDAPAAPGELRVPAENVIKLPRSHWGAYKLISVSNGADRPRGWREWCQFLWNFDFFMGPLPLMKIWTLVIFVCVVLAVWLGKQL